MPSWPMQGQLYILIRIFWTAIGLCSGSVKSLKSWDLWLTAVGVTHPTSTLSTHEYQGLFPGSKTAGAWNWPLICIFVEVKNEWSYSWINSKISPASGAGNFDEAGHSSASLLRLRMSGAIAELIPQSLQLQAQVTLTSLG